MLAYVLYVFNILLGIPWDSWIFGLLYFIIFGNLYFMIFSSIFSSPFFLFSSINQSTHVRPFDIVQQLPDVLLYFLKFIFLCFILHNLNQPTIKFTNFFLRCVKSITEILHPDSMCFLGVGFYFTHINSFHLSVVISHLFTYVLYLYHYIL